MEDIFYPDIRVWHYIENMIREQMRIFGYTEIRTPILEKTELFVRGVGNTTDIVKKEMYTFNDKGERSMTMRPEGTAGVVRSVVEHNMTGAGAPFLKFYYFGQMYRYERPQKGRLRQFNQFGVECFGTDSPYVDAEVIQILYLLLKKLGLSDLDVKLNSIGCPECRPIFREKAIAYLSARKESLCAECRERLEINPLRVYDCKVPSCAAAVSGAPFMVDNLCSGCADHFGKVVAALGDVGIPYTLTKTLVRGLDYYTRTAFEVTSKHLGAQDALGGGGRYDNLVDELGGPKTSAVGFAMGIERIIIAIKSQNIKLELEKPPDVYIIPLSAGEFDYSFKLLWDLRLEGIGAQMAVAEKKAGSHFKDADKLGARFAVVIGSDEVTSENLTVKDLTAHSQEKISSGNIVSYLKSKAAGSN